MGGGQSKLSKTCGSCGQDKEPRYGIRRARGEKKCRVEEVSNQKDSHLQEASSPVYRPAGEGLRANEGPDLVSGQPQCPLRASLREGFQKQRGGKEGTQRQ